jgi:hypothetical protein
MTKLLAVASGLETKLLLNPCVKDGSMAVLTDVAQQMLTIALTNSEWRNQNAAVTKARNVPPTDGSRYDDDYRSCR